MKVIRWKKIIINFWVILITDLDTKALFIAGSFSTNVTYDILGFTSNKSRF